MENLDECFGEVRKQTERERERGRERVTKANYREINRACGPARKKLPINVLAFLRKRTLRTSVILASFCYALLQSYAYSRAKTSRDFRCASRASVRVCVSTYARTYVRSVANSFAELCSTSSPRISLTCNVYTHDCGTDMDARSKNESKHRRG